MSSFLQNIFANFGKAMLNRQREVNTKMKHRWRAKQIKIVTEEGNFIYKSVELGYILKISTVNYISFNMFKK